VNVAPDKALLAVSNTLPLLSTFSRSVPSPVPVLAVTVYVLPDTGVTTVTAGVPPRPTLVSEKSAASAPVTTSLNVTVHDTDEALLGDVPARAADVTVGGVTSLTTVTVLLEPLVAVQLW